MLKSAILTTLLCGLIAWTAASVKAVGADLVVVQNGATTAQIIAAPEAGQVTEIAPAKGKRPAQTSVAHPWEGQAASDLSKYIERMSGAHIPIIQTPDGIAAALKSTGPLFIVGAEALKDAATKAALDKVTPKNPVWRADAIVVRRVGNRVYIAGSNDMSHYFAVSWLLQNWGCRWYLPTEFGECIPESPTLVLGDLDLAYAPPFEIRQYWLSQKGDLSGAPEFRRRNFFIDNVPPGMGFDSGPFTKPFLAELGLKSLYDISMGDPTLAAKVADKLGGDYAAGKNVSVVILNGNFANAAPVDQVLQAGINNKYSLMPSQTDAMMVFNNNVARILREKYPDSQAIVGGMAYNNLSIPPQRAFTPEPNLLMWLAMPDIDPNHSMNDARSLSKQEYGAMLDRWAHLMKGKLVIYDYDQSQLVWRDLPAPSHAVFAQDVKRYRDAGILGFGTESRGAMATTFLNLYFRGQLMWNPDADVRQMLAEFYPKFYGPAAAPMADYWNTIYAAWDESIATEHEYMVAPAIYTPAVVDKLRTSLAQAQKLIAPLQDKTNPTRNEKLTLERIKFTALSFATIENYSAMVNAAATRNDYSAAIAAGEKALAAREALTQMNPTFTSYKIGERGAAWWPGEVEQMRQLKALTDGTKGSLVAQMPLEWAFHRDPHDSGLARGWAYTPADLTVWNTQGKTLSLAARKDYPNDWEMLRTDLYMQAQGIRHPDGQSYTGFYWYQTPLDLKTEQTTGPVHLMFPGLFNECWLYINGALVAHRDYQEPWWLSDYKFEWDVDLSGKLQPGQNLITLRGSNPHHFGGMFRRPFLYVPH